MATYNYNNEGNTGVSNNGQSLAQGDTLKFNRTGSAEVGTPIRWTVPYEGIYRMYTRGGMGAASDRAAHAAIQTTINAVNLRKGDELIILVGQTAPDYQTGTDMPGAGGGGTFVCKVDNSSSDVFTPFNVKVTPLVVAGGGPGSEDDGTANVWVTTTHTTPSNSNAGTGSPTSYGGGGFRTNGNHATVAGKSFLNGGAGGVNGGFKGGYGGGGAASDPSGGGGGGYTGGQGSVSACESGAPYWFSGASYACSVAETNIRNGEFSLTYSKVLTPNNSANIVKSGNKIILQGIPSYPDIKKYEIDFYVNGTKRTMKTANSAPPATIDLDTMENLHSLLINGTNTFKVDVRATMVSTSTPPSVWFSKTANITLDPRYPEIEWKNYDSQYITPDSVLKSAFKITNINVAHSKTQILVTQNGEEVHNITKEGVEYVDVPITKCSLSEEVGLVTVTANITIKASNPNGFTTDKVRTYTKTYSIQPHKNLGIKSGYTTVQTGDILHAEWTPVYTGAYTMKVYDGINLLAEEGNLVHEGNVIATVNTPSNRCRICVQAQSSDILYPEYFSDYFNITDMFWNTNTIEFPVLTSTVDGSLVSIDVFINDTYRLTFNESTTNYNVPMYFFRKGYNTIRLVATDILNGVIEDSLKFHLDFTSSDVQLLNSLTVVPYHAFVGADGVETYNEGNVTATSVIDLGVMEWESVHHTPSLPTSKVTQKVVVSRTNTEHMNLSPIKITGAIE